MKNHRKSVSFERKSVMDMVPVDVDRIPNPERNASLIDGLRNWLAVHPDPKNRKKEKQPPFVGPTGTTVRKVTLLRTKASGIPVRGGIASRETTVRLDLFRSDKGYVAIPIYLHQIADKRRYPTAPLHLVGKDELVKNANFVMSISPGDHLITTDKDGNKSEWIYSGFNTNDSGIELKKPIEKTDKKLGILRLAKIEKAVVDRIGRYSVIEREKRTWRGAACT